MIELLKTLIMLRKIFNFTYYILGMQFVLWITSFLPNLGLANRIRGALVSPFFKKCGRNFMLAKGAVINVPRKIEIGDNVYLAHDVWINGAGGIKIGNGVIVSPKVVIASTRHEYVNGAVQLRKSSNLPIEIGDGSWIASNSTITMGVKIGRGSIVGACSSVTKDIPDFVFAGGVPAKIVKSLA